MVLQNGNLMGLQKFRGLLDSFKAAVNVLAGGVREIAVIMVGSGLINVDFADLKKIMKERGGKL
mgnify:CR=1 FL=1